MEAVKGHVPHDPLPDEWVQGYDYWACERPEMVSQPGIWWDEDCPKCRIAYAAAIVNGDDICVHTGDGKVIPVRDAPIGQWKEMGLI